LRELCWNELGAPRLLLCDVIQPPFAGSLFGGGQDVDLALIVRLLGAAGISCLDYSAWVFGREPMAVSAAGAEQTGVCMLSVQFAEERMVHVTARRLAGARSSLRIQVVAERGSATLELPRQVSWRSEQGRHTESLAVRYAKGRGVLKHFWHVVRGDTPPAADLKDAYRVFTWLRAAREKWVECRPTPLAD
jgi:predicted dehydrogenase